MTVDKTEAALGKYLAFMTDKIEGEVRQVVSDYDAEILADANEEGFLVECEGDYEQDINQYSFNFFACDVDNFELSLWFDMTIFDDSGTEIIKLNSCSIDRIDIRLSIENIKVLDQDALEKYLTVQFLKHGEKIDRAA